ncbi:MAG: Gfo/Idh/MocA family oxidoreductase [Christensenella sp.]|nr:Gfo/Idh/MocA family oxidoreductase [Christensenella sp.]
MEKIRIGVLGPSEIAFRRTVPALVASNRIEYIGVAYADKDEWADVLPDDETIRREAEKCDKFREVYGGKVFNRYHEMLECDVIDAVYIPLPPGLHGRWQRVALEHGKHVFSEKPFTTLLNDTNENISLASSRGLALHENYAFVFHRQIAALDEIIKSGELGELRMLRSAFSFPYRGANDFRYHKNVGGGAVIDCGGYPLKLATHFLRVGVSVTASSMKYARGHDADVYGDATLCNRDGLTAQIFWGMDNAYKCDVELFGSLGVASTGRVFSPPADMKTVIRVNIGREQRDIVLEPDDQFLHSAEFFCDCICDTATRIGSYNSIAMQSKLISAIMNDR